MATTYPLLKAGSTGAPVAQWQQLLAAAGFPVAADEVASQTFGPSTVAQTQAWQSANGLKPDAQVGNLSWNKMIPPPPITPAEVDASVNEAGARKLLDILSLGTKTDNAFRWKVMQIGARLGIDPNYINAVMGSESGYSPSIKNPTGGAVGLIQFMPATAKAFGTTPDALAAMSGLEQLDYVERFFKPYASKIKSPTDAHMAAFLPAFIGKPSEFVLGRDGDSSSLIGGLSYDIIYKQNKALDADKDGEITVGDVGALIEKKVADARSRPRIEVVPVEVSVPEPPDVGGEVPPDGNGGEGSGGDAGGGFPVVPVAVGAAAVAGAAWAYKSGAARPVIQGASSLWGRIVDGVRGLLRSVGVK